jgi:hypothetical protein
LIHTLARSGGNAGAFDEYAHLLGVTANAGTIGLVAQDGTAGQFANLFANPGHAGAQGIAA